VDAGPRSAEAPADHPCARGSDKGQYRSVEANWLQLGHLSLEALYLLEEPSYASWETLIVKATEHENF
jgi:hypothetical protein